MQAFLVLGYCIRVRILVTSFYALSFTFTSIAEDNSKTVVNHNPLPDITHEDFIALLGPLLAPENYQDAPMSPNVNSSFPSLPASPRPSQSGPNLNSPAPFDWLHFEGRSVKTTLSNITGLDGLARERKWRSHCVFSLDVGRKGKQGVEAVSFRFPHIDLPLTSSTADTSRRCSFFQRAICTGQLTTLRDHTARFFAFSRVNRASACPTGRLLGVRRRCGPFTADKRILPELWVGRGSATSASEPNGWTKRKHARKGNSSGSTFCPQR